jgi:hypothetical protein
MRIGVAGRGSPRALLADFFCAQIQEQGHNSFLFAVRAMNGLQHSVIEFADLSESLWQRYLKLGPGCLPADSFKPIESAQVQIRKSLENHTAVSNGAWGTEFRIVSDELELLLRRCVERSEGLCFVTGEAGLIPIRELHDRCEKALATLNRLKSELSKL